jgi:tRNA A-37 threonylcarbamoyl transferase component Bud32
MVKFDPKPNDTVTIANTLYTVQPHPKAPKMRYGVEGRRATVYQLKDLQGNPWALKVFKKRFQDPALVESVTLLRQFKSLKGMCAAERSVITPSQSIAQRHSNLEYAMLMPWVQGQTWNDVLLKAEQKQSQNIDSVMALRLCAAFLEVMKGLEQHGIAHTDIAPGNVVFEYDHGKIDIQLLDLEDLYKPGLPIPVHQNAGTTGYSHCSAETGAGFWRASGDRYAAAVLAAEILILANPKLSEKMSENGFFEGHQGSPISQSRYAEAESWLQMVAPQYAALFRQAWYEKDLEKCPSLTDLHTNILNDLNATVPAVIWKPMPPLPSAQSNLANTETTTSVQKNTTVVWERLIFVLHLSAVMLLLVFFCLGLVQQSFF